MIRSVSSQILAQIIGSFVRFNLLLVILIGVDPADDCDRHQDDGHDDHNRGRKPALKGDRARGLHGIGDSVVFERQQRLSLRPTKTSVAQSSVFGVEGVYMLPQVGDFLLVIHTRFSNTKLERSANAEVVASLAEGASAAQFDYNSRSP